MICKKCGKKINDEFAYCPLCGASQEEAAKAASDGENVKSGESSFGCFVAFLAVAIAVIIIVAIVAAWDGGKTQGSGTSSGGGTAYIPSLTKRKAKNEDVILQFNVIPGIFEEDTHYVKLQTQEKITDLRLEISFLDADERVLLTQTVNAGKVVPGNEYSYRLSLTGMAFKDLDAIEKYSWRVSGGMVEEE